MESRNNISGNKSRKGGAGKRPLLTLRFLPFYLFTFILLMSCTSIDCPVQNTVYTIYNMYKSDGTPDTLRDTLTVYVTRSDGTDSVVLNRSVNTTEMDLPISYSAPADTLCLVMKDTLSVIRLDTIIVSKTNEPHFESVDCSASFFHEITGVSCTHNAIDSIVINKTSVNYDSSTEHFHLYLRSRR